MMKILKQNSYAESLNLYSGTNDVPAAKARAYVWCGPKRYIFGKAHERTVRGLPVMGATRLNLRTHLKTEINVEQVHLHKGKWRSRGLDGLYLKYDGNIGKLAIRVSCKDFYIAEAKEAGHYPFGFITPIVPNEPSPAIGFCFFMSPVTNLWR
jgi:hypothetical protein